MLITDRHLHALEYYRDYGKGQRAHVYTERVNDQGFVLQHDPELRPAWLARYTRTCADDYLARVHAEPGTWLIHVYRLLDGERNHLVSVRMRWPATEPENVDTPTGAPGRRRPWS